jgi:hypothetical protein
LTVGILGAVAILALPFLRHTPKLAAGLVAGLGLSAALIAPLFSTIATAATPHSGAIPAVTPSPAGGAGFPGRGGGGGGFPGGGRFAGGRGVAGGRGFPGGGRGFARAGGGTPNFGGTATGTGGFPTGGFPGGGFGRAGGGIGGGGFLNASSSNPALTKLLKANASRYTWVAATVNSNSAAGYQLASDDPVMAIGGFNGTDPAPTLTQFEQSVAEGKIHYFISGGGAGGFGGGASGDDATKITSWVESHFTSKSVDGTTVYDLTTQSS